MDNKNILKEYSARISKKFNMLDQAGRDALLLSAIIGIFYEIDGEKGLQELEKGVDVELKHIIRNIKKKLVKNKDL